MTYCEYIETLPPGEKRDLHGNYHDNHYGFPLHDDNELFGRLILEINQAGLNWEIILRKEKAFLKDFTFTGGEIVNEFLMSIGFLPGTHDKSCPAYKKIIKQNPMWMRK